MKLLPEKKISLPAALLLGILLLAGLFVYQDYGVSWDEPMQRDMGNLCYDYVTGQSNDFFNIQNKYHNSTWELINVLPERWLKPDSVAAVYASRHLMNYLLFWVSSVFFYLLARQVLKKEWLALVAVLMLYLTPRIFAHAFYNSKDIPVLAFFIISVYAGVMFILKPGWKRMLPLALLSGMAFGMRILGIMIPFLVSFFFIMNIFTRNLQIRDLKWLALYGAVYPLFLYACVPVLWPAPFFHFREAFAMHSHFPYTDTVLFMGDYLLPSELPWYYVPVWIGISVPVLWQLFFITGLFAAGFRKLTGLFSFLKNDWGVLLAGVWFFAPWLMVLVLHSHLYDEWRHLYFTYPAFILVGLFGVRTVLELTHRYAGKRIQFLVSASLYFVLAWQTVVTAAYMFRNHPHQYVYFNLLAGDAENIHRRYEMDYWGLSYKQAWRYLLGEQDEIARVKDVEWQNNPGLFNLVWFTQDELNSINHARYDDCHYFITNYRWYPEYTSFKEKYYSVIVDGMEIMTIYINPAYQVPTLKSPSEMEKRVNEIEANENIMSYARTHTGDDFQVFSNGMFEMDSVKYEWYKIGMDNGYAVVTSVNVLYDAAVEKYYIYDPVAGRMLDASGIN